MLDEFRAQEFYVVIGLVAVINEALWAFLGFIVSMESVARGVRTDKTFTGAYVIKDRLFTRR